MTHPKHAGEEILKLQAQLKERDAELHFFRWVKRNNFRFHLWLRSGAVDIYGYELAVIQAYENDTKRKAPEKYRKEAGL